MTKQLYWNWFITGNIHRDTRNNIHLLIMEYTVKYNVYFLVGDASTTLNKI